MLILFYVLAAYAQFPEEDHILVLTNQNFENALKTYPKLLVEFYAPWCDHCKELAPEFSKAAKALKSKGIPLAKIDGSEFRDLADKYKVKGYPSIIYFIEGSPTDYTGLRTSEGIISWLTERQKTKIEKIQESRSISSLSSTEKLTAVFFGKLSHSERSIFEFASLNVKDCLFYETEFEHHAEELQVTQPKVLIFENGHKHVYDKDFSTLELVKFLEKLKPAKVHIFNDQTGKMIFDYQSTSFFFLSGPESLESHKSNLKSLANQYKDLFIFTTCDLSSKGNGEKLSDALGLLPRNQPMAVIVDFQGAFNKYQTSELSLDSLIHFIENYKAKSLKPYYKSAPLPSSENENNVKVLVGLNYEETIKDSNKVVVVLYYTPEHPKCAEFLPKYERLAKETRRWENLIVSKFDLSKNEFEGLKIKTIPHVQVFTPDNKEGAIYLGQFIKSDLKDFLRQFVGVNKDL